jgi:hypothetical protein
MPNQKPLSGFEEYADYTQNYYSDPQPYLLPQAFIQLTKSEGLDANRLRVSLIFFHHVLLRNLYLLDDFIDLYPSLTPQGQTFLILLLSGFPELDMVKGFAQGLKEEPRHFSVKLQKMGLLSLRLSSVIRCTWTCSGLSSLP